MNSICCQAPRDCSRLPGAEIVEHPHAIAALHQRLHDVRTNESGAAGN